MNDTKNHPVRQRTPLRDSFLIAAAAGIGGHGIHYGLILASAGMAAMGGLAFNLGVFGASALLGYGVWYRFADGRTKPRAEKQKAFAIQALMAGAVYLGAAGILGHDHRGHNAQEAWFQSLPPDVRGQMISQVEYTLKTLPNDLRLSFDQEARAYRLSPVVYFLICAGNQSSNQSSAARAVMDFLATARKNPTPSPQIP